MTRVTRGNYKKQNGSVYGVYHHRDECRAISDHLRNHVHLTNCIHLRNHMHRHSPVLAERSLMRDLIILQKSRSLRDPSTSPPSWLSPSIVGVSTRGPLRDGSVHSGRRSLGGDRQREIGQLSTSSPMAASIAASKIAAAEAHSIHSAEFRINENELYKGEDSMSRKNHKSRLSTDTNNLSKDFVFHNTEARDGKGKRSPKGYHAHSIHLKTLSEQLEGIRNRSENERGKYSQIFQHLRHIGEGEPCGDPKDRTQSQSRGLNRRKKRAFRTVRRARVPAETGNSRIDKDQSVASNSLAQGPRYQKSYAEEGVGDETEPEVSQAPRNGCGIPWNWSRIHHRGKNFLDLAGRSLACGLSDSRLRKAEGNIAQSQGDTSNNPISSNNQSSSTNSDSESLPLLIEPPASQESDGNPALAQDYSGELGIYANHGLQHGEDSELTSEARWGCQQKSRCSCNGRHRCLTQKYMPKTFKDLVGQNLVVQALSNAVLRRKVGLVYVFYGPHGTGKTSCARIFAKALNCQSAEHPKPCNMCKSCISHNLGKSRNILEVGPVGNFDFEGVMSLLDGNMLASFSSQYRIFIFDDCDALSPDSWNAISKVMDRAPRQLVFVIISSNLDQLPHLVISRCQKFYFSKIKDSDIIHTLQWIATSEGLEINKDALKLIASRSDGSLRDAEMTLDQLSLLGQRISLPLVQELVGLVSDDKLVDLLDLALSADTVNTVKSLREIMEAGVEPLALMSQLATIITDILAGSYTFTQQSLCRRFFRRQILSKEDMEKLRQALKTLSEAEKQLRLSNDKLTWLTAALLQLAPDHQYMLPSSSQETSLNHSPMVVNNVNGRDVPRHFVSARQEAAHDERRLSRGIVRESTSIRSNDNAAHEHSKTANRFSSGKKAISSTPPQTLVLSNEASKGHGGYKCAKKQEDEEIWEAVLDILQPDAVKQFVSQEGKLLSVNLGSAPTVQLMFSSHLNKSKAEKFRSRILQAFESILCSPVILEIRYESRKDAEINASVPLPLPACKNSSSQMAARQEFTVNQNTTDPRTGNCIRRVTEKNIRGLGPNVESKNVNLGNSMTSSQEHQPAKVTDDVLDIDRKEIKSVWLGEGPSSQYHDSLVPLSERREGGEPKRQSLVKSRVSLAHVIQKAESCTQRSGWSRRKAISIAEKLEQENLRLEPRSKSLLCWRVSRLPRGKLQHWRIRAQKPRALLRLVACGRCLSARSSREAASSIKLAVNDFLRQI